MRQTLFRYFTFLFLCLPFIAQAATQPAFESPEHEQIGNAVILHADANDAGQAGGKLTLANGLQLTYGEILTLGDFYEIPFQSISLGETEGDREARFKAAFHSFSKNTASINETTEIIDAIHYQDKLVAEGVSRGETPEQVYENTSDEFNRRYNCITGGGCSKGTWWTDQGRYLELASADYDHFGSHAQAAYIAGHQAALAQAIKARTKGPAALMKAYAMNAFACHFLSDRFAAGHIRTPRYELATVIKPALVGSLLAHFMHEEENHYGLQVHNGRGDHWQVMGDRSYMSTLNTDNRRILNETMQTSADEIFNAYLTGQLPEKDRADELLPIADEVGDSAKLDISALFYWDEKKQTLMRRSTLESAYARGWTDRWWGVSTLARLQAIKH